MNIFFAGKKSGLNSAPNDNSSVARIAKNMGHTIDADNKKFPDIAICVDFSSKDVRALKSLKKKGVPLVLVKQEPVVTAPVHRHANPKGLFDMVITRGDPNSDLKFNTFQEWDTRFLTSRQRKSRVAAINANKWSAVPGELYSLRRKCYALDPRVDLHGHGWAEGFSATGLRMAKEIFIAISSGIVPQISNLRWGFLLPANYQGPAEDKILSLSAYKVSLVIENCQSYMSEKLVDSILAGCIPVYVGADPKLFDIPDDLYVRAAPDSESVKKSIDRALEMNHTEFLLSAKNWAESPGVKETWEHVAVVESLIRHVEQFLLDYKKVLPGQQ